MFISSNELKGLIIDVDSFPLNLDIQWSNIDGLVKLLFFSTNSDRLVKLKQLNNRSITHLGTPIGNYADKKTVYEQLAYMGLRSYEAAFLTNSYDNLLCIQELPLSTIRFSAANTFEHYQTRCLPDFIISSIDELNAIIRKENGGYFSEVLAIYPRKTKRYSHQYYSFLVDKIRNAIFEHDVVSGGRYFKTDDIRHSYHQLSKRIIRNKEPETRQDKIFTNIYSGLINQVNEILQKVHGITRIPPRPTDEDDKFWNVVNAICSRYPQYENLASNLIGVKDYESQKQLNSTDRYTNVSGAFKAQGDFAGKHIVLIDDIISTGATAKEAAKVLMEAGADKVTIVVLGVNQINNAIRRLNHVPLNCKCGGEFQMRFKREDESAFFGCSNYWQKGCRETLPYDTAINLLNVANKIDADTEADSLEWLF